MHHKSLLSLVSSISSKQGPREGQVPHLCLCTVGSRVESWSQMVNGKKVNPTAGIFNKLLLTKPWVVFSPPPFSSASGPLASTFLAFQLAVASCC